MSMSKKFIAICITTHNRYEYFKRCYDGWIKHLPPDSRIFVVDDASDVPCPEATYRFEKSAGIPKAKNMCLELAQDFEHIILADDDIWPITEDWWLPYVESPEAHLSYCWSDIRPGMYGNAHYYSIGKRLYEDDKLFSFSHPRGQMLYIDAKKVLPRVGGFDPAYGKGMVEHVDWSWRIHNAGLSTWKNQDVIGSEDLFYSIDENQNNEPDFVTTISDEMRTVIDQNNQRILHAKGDSSEYIEYRENTIPQPVDKQNNVIICGVFTGKPDFQINWGARHSPIADPQYTRDVALNYADDLKDSVMRHEQKLVILNNIADASDGNTRYIYTGCSEDPYKNRFLKALHYLIEHEEIDNAWIVDSGDVTMNHNPFPEMQRDKIYVGCETMNHLGCNWMLQNTKNSYYQHWLNTNANKTLLNCGLLGGSRENLIAFLTKMFYIWGYNVDNMNLIDMLVFNVTAYEHFKEKIVYGVGLVNNRFRSMEATNEGKEFWLHK